MHYIYSFEIAALAVLLVIAGRYFYIKKFSSPLTYLFSALILAAICNISFDIIASVSIDYAGIVPVFWVELFNWLFYFTQVLFLTLIQAFSLTLVTSYGQMLKKYAYSFLPSVIVFLLLLTTPFTHIFFTITQTEDGIHFSTGIGPILNYLCAAWNLGFSLVIAVKNRKNLATDQFKTIIAYTLVSVLFMVLQFIMGNVLLTGLALTLSILMMSYNLQNPKDMLDSSNVFNLAAFMIFLRDVYEKKRTLYVIAFKISEIERFSNIFGTKAANELMGEIGDFLLTLVKNDWAFRIGSSKFAVCCFNENRYNELTAAIKERLSQEWTLGSGTVRLLASVCQGIERDPDNLGSLLSVVSATLDEMDAADSIHTKTINGEIEKNIKRKFAIEAELRAAIQEGGDRFVLLYQPIYDFRKKCFTGAESLLRMTSRNGDMIMPSEFIPVAEITGLIRELDRIVLEKACVFLENNPEIYSLGLESLHVNLSAGDDFTGGKTELHKIVTQHGITPQRICFEITETAAMNNMYLITSFMEEMNLLGYRFAMDDFGTGYSNLSGMGKMPFSVIKIDKSLLPEGGSETAEKIFLGMSNMLKDIGKAVVVEGVETEAQCSFVRNSRADYIQGYYYSKPLPEKTFLEFMEKQKTDRLR